MATKQEIQLEILNLEYSRFVKDQVLTEGQLNEIIDFFEDQHRVTRTCLIGTGIVCGLHLTRHASTKVVRLGAGAAVTTDGDLMKINDTEFRYFKEYQQPEGAHYDPFYYKQGSEEKFITLFELLTEEQKNGLNSPDFGEIKDLDSTISDWVAILFLEYYLKDPEKCTPTDCDNMGMRQVARPRVLVLSKADMDKIIHKDAGETIGDAIYLKYRDAFERYFTFPVIKARRVMLNYASTLKSTTLAGAYFTAAKNGSSALTTAIKELHSAFRFVIDKGGNADVEGLISALNGHLTTPSNTLFGQYTYDYYKDVITAYNELRESLFHIGTECCADIYSFPKHIMLGAPNVEYGPIPPEYRHRFYPSPALSKHKDLLQHAISLFARLQAIILNFNPIQPGKIKITPSRDYDTALNKRAIPFYYKNINLLLNDWDHSKSLKNQEKLTLSYHSDHYAPPVPDESLHPLDYDLDPNDFFRVEGHIGMEWKKAMADLEEIRKQKGLPMDIVAVRMGDVRLADIDLDDFKCHFEDLDAILKAFQAEINCLLSEGAMFFSGFTTNKERPHINLTRYVAKEGDPNWIITKAFAAGLAGTVVEPERTAPGGITRITGRTVRERTAGIVRDAVPAATESIRKDFSRATAGIKRVPAAKDFCDPFVRPPFKVERVVKSRIDTDPTVFGRFYAQVLEEDISSVDEFTEKVRTLAIQDPDFSKLNEDERYIMFEYPTMVVGYLNLSQRFVPAYLADISSRLIDDYREFAQAFCKRIKSMHTRLERYFKTGDYTMRGYENRYFNMLDNLEKICCGYEKLEVIMREVEKRKEEILKRLSFARYASDHPGLEHKAGVHRGGTFVIVYEGSQGKRRLRPARDLTALREVTGLDSLTRDGGFDPRYRDADAFAYYIVAHEDNLDLEEELSNFLTFQKVQPGGSVAERLVRDLNSRIEALRKVLCADLNPPDQDIVVADFCLPYLCCSDCAPMAFIIPGEKKVLALPVDTACNNQDPIPFSAYSPKGAVISSPEAGEAIIPGDNPAFDPKKVPNDQLGKTITFTLNGESTECTIVVFNPMQLALGFDISDTGDDTFLVTYSNSTNESLTGQRTYLWKFNEGLGDHTQTGTGSFEVTYSRAKLKEMGIAVITASVTVMDDPCHSSGSLSFDVPEGSTGGGCPEIVAGFIASHVKAFTTDAYKERVRATQSTKLVELYSQAVKVLVAAEKIIGTNRPPTKIISAADDLLQQIYKFQESFQHKDIPRILEDLLRMLLMLMLNMVRCMPEIPPDILQIIAHSLDMFNEMKNIIREKYPQLDLNNILENQVTDYVKNFESQDPTLIKKLEIVIRILEKFPESR